MLIFDELKKNDPQLRLVAVVLAGGLVRFARRLVVGAGRLRARIREPSGNAVLPHRAHSRRARKNSGPRWPRAGGKPSALQPEPLSRRFAKAIRGRLCAESLTQARADQAQRIAAQEKKLGRSLTKAERRQFALHAEEREQLRDQARFQVASDVVRQVSERLGQPLALDEATFDRAYDTRLALPYPLLTNLDTAQIARFEEQYTGTLGVDLDLQPVRIYPFGTTAAICSVICSATTVREQGEDASFSIIACRIIAAWWALKAASTRSCADGRARRPCWSTISAIASPKTF